MFNDKVKDLLLQELIKTQAKLKEKEKLISELQKQLEKEKQFTDGK